MNTRAFWQQFGEAEQKGIKIALAFFIAFVVICTLWGGLAGKSWSSAAAIFVDSVGAFGQVSIAAGLYLLTRHQLHEARAATQKATEALDLAKREAEAEADRHIKEIAREQERQLIQDEREQTREHQIEIESVNVLINRLDNVCGSIIESCRNSENVNTKCREDLRELTSFISAKKSFSNLEVELKKLCDIGVRVGGPRAGKNDIYTFSNTRKSVLNKLREFIP